MPNRIQTRRKYELDRLLKKDKNLLTMEENRRIGWLYQSLK